MFWRTAQRVFSPHCRCPRATRCGRTAAELSCARNSSSICGSAGVPSAAAIPAPFPRGRGHTRGARIVLGIESSCDETAVAIVSEDRRVLAEVVSSQWEVHAELGGVMPHLAARAHARNLPPVLARCVALAEADGGLPGGLADIDAVAVSVGPGLAPCLKVGLHGAKDLFFGRWPGDDEDGGRSSSSSGGGNGNGGGSGSSGGGGGGGGYSIYGGDLTLQAAHADGVAATANAANATATAAAACCAPLPLSMPLVPVHHMEAHALVTRLFDADVSFPFLALLVSGGHCQLVLARAVGDYVLLGTTLDDSVGEAYDKVARMLRVPAVAEHGGAALERLARRGDATAFSFKVPMERRNDCHFSFSGLKTAVLYTVNALLLEKEREREKGKEAGGDIEVMAAPAATLAQQAPVGALSAVSLGELRRESDSAVGARGRATQGESGSGGRRIGTVLSLAPEQQANLAASFQRAAVAHLSQRTRRALRWCSARHPGQISELVVCGGVAANAAVRAALTEAAEEAGVRAVFPPPRYCTDNGVMVAWAGMERLRRGAPGDVLRDANEVAALDFKPRWPLGSLVEGEEAVFSFKGAEPEEVKAKRKSA